MPSKPDKPNKSRIGNQNQSVMSKRSHHAGAGVHSTMSKSKYGGSVQASRTVLSSNRSTKHLPEVIKGDKTLYKPPVHVMDPDSGKDVTPQPLLHLTPSQVRKNQSHILMEQSSQGGQTPTDLQSQASIYQGGTVNASTMFGGGPFTRSVFSASGAASDSDGTVSIHDEGLDGASHHAAADISAWGLIQREEQKEDLAEGDLEKEIVLNLEESETIWILDMPGISMQNDSDSAKVIKARNEKYQELCKSRAGNDLYTERGMTTFNDAPKLKVVQTDKIGHNDVMIAASNWDMYDTYALAKQLEDAANADKNADIMIGARPSSGQAEGSSDAGSSSSVHNDTKKSLHTTSTAAGTVISKIVEESDIAESMISLHNQGSAESAEEIRAAIQAKKNDEILNCKSLKDNLFIIERIINLNTYQAKLACYRGYEPIISEEAQVDSQAEGEQQSLVEAGSLTSPQGPNLERLWTYVSPLTKGKNVSCCAWNRVNPDLIAIGYGQYEFVNQKGGLVACWSLKNPEYPERLFSSEVGVTAMDFSLSNPNLLAVGLYDGTIAVYNVKHSKSEPVLDTFECNQRHTAPIWQLRWIEKDKGKASNRTRARHGGDEPQSHEVLISISADGRVCQWTIRKGFECADLMKLKRVQLKQHVGGKAKSEKRGDALISRLAGGFCFAFSALDPMLYITGTEEGFIHKCSCSYNEQYLDTFEGHGGPVYELHWSPFCKNVFLSCSADWSIRLWRQDRLRPVLSFFSSTKSVNNICWSPYSSTVFACVNDSAVEVWDLSQSTLDPIIVNASTGPKQTTVRFASNSETILVGDSTGQMTVYQLRGMPASPENQEEALNKIILASLASQLQEEDSRENEEKDEDEEEAAD